MIFKPLRNDVLVKVKEIEEEGIIIVPDSAKDRSNEGTVVVVGEAKYKSDIEIVEIKKGDTILFNSLAGREIKLNDEKFLLLTQNDIFGILEEHKELTDNELVDKIGELVPEPTKFRNP